MDGRYVEQTTRDGSHAGALAAVLSRLGHVNLVVPLVFAVHVSLVFSAFIPNLKEVTGFAESAYINNGRMLFEGVPTPFGYSPLSSFLYALTYIPVKHSAYWLIYSCSLGRILLFSLLWTASYLVAMSFGASKRPPATMALVVASPAFLNVSAQASHALFVAMSGLALWQFLRFYEHKTMRYLVGTSFFVALSALARSGEGMVLWFAVIFLAVWLSWRVRPARAFFACIVPCAVILGGYMLIYRGAVGKFDVGMAEYSYFTFEQGHGLAHQSEYPQSDNFYVSGQIDARSLFGTPEDNHYSIVQAVVRNPRAYLQRIPGLFRQAPQYIIEMYGGTLGWMLLLFAGRGAIELFKRKFGTVLVILLFWVSYMPIYFFLVYQPTHFLFPCYIVFLLASLGLERAVENFDSEKERFLWFASLGALLAAGFILQRAISFSTALFLLLIFTILWVIVRQYREVESIKTIGIILILAGFIIKADYPVAEFRTLGVNPDEKATMYMKDQLPPTAVVGSYEPKNIWMAKLTYIPMFRSTLPEIKTDQDLVSWMKHNHLKAIYVDPPLKILEPAIWSLVEKQIGHALDVGFSSESGDYQVLLTRGNISDGNLQGYVARPWYSSKDRFPS